jgi:hypothetical protein
VKALHVSEAILSSRRLIPEKEIPSQGAVPLEIPRGQKLGVMALASTVIHRVSQSFRPKNANKICVFEKKASIISL